MKTRSYENIVSYLIKTQNIAEEDRALYIYALKILSRTVVNLISVIITGLIFNMLKEALVVFACFFVLRKFLGGVHAESYAVCFISSTLIFVLSLVFVKYASYIPSAIWICVSVISIILIVIFSPVKHPNKIMNEKEANVYKKISVAAAVVITAIAVICLYVKADSIGFSLIVGELLSAILMLFGVIKYRTAENFD